MANSIQLIQALRRLTGAGMLDCKKALAEAGDDLEQARKVLRAKGQEVARKKQEREAREGVIGSYVHTNHKIACLVKLYCETDFVARNQEFLKLAHDLALQVIASNALYVRSEDISEAEIAEFKAQILRELASEHKLPELQAKIVAGKMQKTAAEICLLDQPFFKNPEITVQELIAEMTLKLGEKIEVGEFVRFEI